MKKQTFVASLLSGVLLCGFSANLIAQEQPKPIPAKPPVAANPNPPAAGKRQTICFTFDVAENVSPEKQAYIKKALQDLREQIRPQMSMLHAKQGMLRAQLMQSTIDKKQVVDLVKEINDLRAKILQEWVDTSLKIKDNTGVSIPFHPLSPHGRGQFMLMEE